MSSPDLEKHNEEIKTELDFWIDQLTAGTQSYAMTEFCDHDCSEILKFLEELQQRRQCRHPDEIKKLIKIHDPIGTIREIDGPSFREKGRLLALHWVLSPEKG